MSEYSKIEKLHNGDCDKDEYEFCSQDVEDTDTVEENFDETLDVLLIAAEYGDADAQYILTGYDDIGEDWFWRAPTLLKESAACGNVKACIILARLYHNGNKDYNVNQDFAETVKWANKAIEYDSDCDIGDLWFLLGDSYHNGYYVNQDLERAKNCYQKAIELRYNCRYALEMVQRDLDKSRNKQRSTQMQIYAEKLRKENVPDKRLPERIEEDLAADFVGYWDDVKSNAQKALVSGMFTYITYYKLGKAVYDNLDFSGVITPMAKALETELAEFFHTGYIRYLKHKNVSPAEFGQKRLSFIMPDSGVYADETDTSKFSLGSLYYTMENSDEIDNSRSVASRKTRRGYRTVSKFMADYANELFAYSAFSDLNRESEIVNYLVDLATDVYTIMQSRNPAAHSQTMPIDQAEVCGDYLVKVQKLICNFIAKIKPEYRKGYRPK